MFFSVLGSGSKGNSVYIESGKTSILIDAGFSGKKIAEKLSEINRSIEDVDAILLTHEHSDHISGAGVLSRRCKIPLIANDGTLKGGEKILGKIPHHIGFTTGESLPFQDLQIRSFRTLHDTQDPVGFIVGDGNYSVGYCTDTGKVTHLMGARMQGCDAIILEFNHDLEMLKAGPYPLALQQRVRSSHGHLANDDAAEFLMTLLHEQLQHIILAHLSEVNNLPNLAYDAAERVIDGCSAQLTLARQDSPMPLVDLKSRR